MIKELKIPVALRVVPIKRDKHGLALSSRNSRLEKKHKKKAPVLHDTLQLISKIKYEYNVEELEEYAMEQLAGPKGFRPEYFTIVDANTLKGIKRVKNHDYVVACLAVWAGDVRLIDNMILRRPLKNDLFIETN